VWALPLQGLGFFFAAALIAFDQENRLLVSTAVIAVLGVTVKIGALLAGGLPGFCLALLATLAAYALCTGIQLFRHLRPPLEDITGPVLAPCRRG